MELTIDYESIKNQFNIEYINNLIKVCDKHNINKQLLYKTLEGLQKIKDDQISETNIAIIKSKSNLSLSESSYNDDYLYKKPWTKLTAIHKIIKIKEFVNQLLIDNENDKQILKDILIEMVKNKTLTKKDDVLYDSNSCKIISITRLQHKNGKYSI